MSLFKEETFDNYGVPKLQSCLVVRVANLGPEKTVRVENLEENV